MKKLNLDVIRLDGGTQARVKLDEWMVSEYSEAMKDGDVFPPVVVFHDGSDYWLADGFHRYHATRQLGLVSIEVEVKTGTVHDAQLFAFGANAKRGLSTNNEDNKSIVLRMLEHPISKSWTNAEIARHVGVSKMTVGRIRATVDSDVEVKTYQRKDGKTVSVNTKKLATKKAKEKEEEEPDHKVAELAETVNALEEENQKLRDAIAVGQWDATEIEKIDVQDTLAQLRERIRVLEIDNSALRDSRDMFQSRNAELMDKVKSLQAKLKKVAK